MMDFLDSPDELAFRQTFRQWLHTELANGAHGLTPREWHRRLYAAGYVGLSWPTEVGGRGLGPTFSAILNEEAGIVGAPAMPAIVNYLGRSILEYGTEQQQQRFLRRMLVGDDLWCQGFSEPEAGSDLASLRTRAVLDGDNYVVHGHKQWTSGGVDADWCLLLARLGSVEDRHRDLICLLVPMDSEGISVSEIRLSNGIPETSEVVFDGVRVPVENVLGIPGRGWSIAMTTFTYERGPADVGVLAEFRRTFEDVKAEIHRLGLEGDTLVRSELARAWVRGEALRLQVLQQLSDRAAGIAPGDEGSVAKLLAIDAEQYLHRVAIDLVGADCDSPGDGTWMERYLKSRVISIVGGTEQIQKNIIARRILALGPAGTSVGGEKNA